MIDKDAIHFLCKPKVIDTRGKKKNWNVILVASKSIINDFDRESVCCKKMKDTNNTRL